jgi:hypothetical protein
LVKSVDWRSETNFSAFVWHESFNGVDSEYLGAQYFDERLLNETGTSLGLTATEIAGIVEDDLTGELSFSINGDAPLIVSVRIAAVPETTSTFSIVIGACFLAAGRRRLS